MRPDKSAYIVFDRAISRLSNKRLEVLAGVAIQHLLNYRPAQRADLITASKPDIVHLTLLSGTGKLLHRFLITLQDKGTKAEVTRVALP